MVEKVSHDDIRCCGLDGGDCMVELGISVGYDHDMLVAIGCEGKLA